MFAFLRGIVAEKSPVTAVLDCNGVGYDIHIPLSTFDLLPAVGQECTLYIHVNTTENDGIRLFGFATQLERTLFRHLISISKIGPKLALAILSSLSVSDFVGAVQTQNAGLLSTVPGIGKKSAERLIIEMKDKVGAILTSTPLHPRTSDVSTMMQEAEAALVTLGYRPADVAWCIADLAKEQSFSSAEEMVKAVIKSLYKKR
ncbi:MAG: Holliday junction branch migration protein RuvA [Candidatus Cloacimonetes bacterium]|nr:Holliday junction branch migration protein RuvA [Candidatus Cloacimonadota bacterium]